MKNLLLATMLLAVLVWALPAFAEVTFTPEAEINITFEKDYEMDEISDIELESQAYLVGCKTAIGENLVLAPKIGMWNSAFEGEGAEFENSVGLALGIDGSYKLIRLDPVTLSLIGSYMYADSEIDTVKISNLKLDIPLKTDIDIHSYEVGLQAAFDTPFNLTPYLGIVYSDSKINVNVKNWIGEGDFDLEAEDNFGLRIGVTGSPTEDLTLGLEGRLIDKKAVVARVCYKF